MALVLDAPQTVSSSAGSSGHAGAGKHPAADSQDAVAASQLLEGGIDGDGEGSASGDPTITVTIVRNVEDPVCNFSASKGDTFTAAVDRDGDTYIPFGEQRIYLEAEEFEVVELNDDTIVVPDDAPEGAVAETGGNAGESSVTNDATASDTPVQASPDSGGCATSDQTAIESPLSESVCESGGAGQVVASGEVSLAAGQIIPSGIPTGWYAYDASPAAAAEPKKLKEPFELYCDEKQALEEQLSDLVRECSHLKERAKSAKKAAEVVAEKIDKLVESWESGKYTEGIAAERAGKRPEAESATAGGGTAIAHSSTPLSTAASGMPPESPASQPAESQATATVAASSEAEVDMTSRLRAEHEEQQRYQTVLEAATIGELDLPPKIEEKLIEANATTIWKLEELRGEISLGKAKWPKGIGPGKVTTIEDAISNWVARNRASWVPSQQQQRQPAESGQVVSEQPATAAAAETVAASEAAEPAGPEASQEHATANDSARAVTIDDL